MAFTLPLVICRWVDTKFNSLFIPGKVLAHNPTGMRLSCRPELPQILADISGALFALRLKCCHFLQRLHSMGLQKVFDAEFALYGVANLSFPL